MTPSRSGEHYTRQELDRAIYLRDLLKLRWSVIAARLQRPQDALETQVCRHRRGQIKFDKPRMRQESEEMAELAFSGLSLSEIARQRGCYPSNIWQRLQRIGVDQEIIQETRKERGIAG